MDRLEKVKKMRKIDISPYRNDFKPTMSISEARRMNTGMKLSIGGRVLTIRDFGGSAFFHIKDGTGKIQCFIERENNPEGIKFFREFVDIGDIVGCSGYLFKTKKGELTIYIEELKILTKALKGLPEKWHGLKDVETRLRQRYLDLTVNDDVKEIFLKRSKIISLTRKFFEERGFVEVETPIMQPIPGGALARPFKTYHNVLGIDLYMRIAPELYLKRLVIGGFERVFEIGRNLRNEGVSSQHNPEFTMLEFYMTWANYEDLMELTEELITSLAERVNGGVLKFGSKKIALKRPFNKIRLEDEVKKFLGIDNVRDTSKMRKIAKELGLEVDGEWGQVVVEIFERKIAGRVEEPTFVVDFPTEVSPLAKRKDNDPEIAERFELYIFGMEIANAFSELCDPLDQKRRMEKQLEMKLSREDLREGAALDEDFLSALEYGMPPVAGEGIGMDRLIMILTGATSIREVILFPLLKPK